MSGLLDTVGMFDLAAALPEQVAAAATLGAEVDGLPDHDGDRAGRGARHGRQRGGRRRAGRRGRSVHARARHRRQGLRGAGVGRRGHAVLRHLLLRRHRGDRRGGPGRPPSPAPTWSCSPPAAQLGALARVVGRAPHRAARLPDAARRHRLGERPAAHGPRAGRPVPGRDASTSPTRSTSSQRRRDKLIVDGGPAQQLARAIGRTMPIAYGGDALGGGGGLPVQVPGQRERQGARVLGPRCPRWPTTRSAAGASTATSPAR